MPGTAAHLDAGTAVTVTPKNPLTSTTLWGIAVVIVFRWLSSHKWWTWDQTQTAQAIEDIMMYAGLALAAIGRWRANRPLGMHDMVRTVIRCVPILLLLAAGCGMSQSYKLEVPNLYGTVASRMDQLQPGTQQAAALRASTQPSPSFPAMQQAWHAAEPVYDSAITASQLNAQRKADWLYTAQVIDRLNADEAKYEGLFAGNGGR